MPKAFGAGNNYKFYDANSENELIEIMDKIKNPTQLTVVKLNMDPFDIPDDLVKFASEL
ncbi:hypothetical protein ACQW5G_04835 [Fructilactobacillus sp. Tb1]|uniref:hypothetical protein n=1 Tax=Fructilactobacillus sp. Tb1 TaxID=3422304 RepID=UPI003D27A71E